MRSSRRSATAPRMAPQRCWSGCKTAASRRSEAAPAPCASGREAPNERGAPPLPEAAAVEGDEPLPMALGGGLVPTPALGKSETVMHAGIELDLAGAAGAGEEAAQFLDHRQRRQFVVLGAGDVEFAPDLSQ